MDSIYFAGLTFRGLTKDILLNGNGYKRIVTVNADFITEANNNEKLKRIIDENYSTFDGQVPWLIAKLKNKDVNIEKISGCDFIYDLCEYASLHNYKVFLLGGKPDSNQKSVNRLALEYDIKIAGFSPENKPYPFDIKHNEQILKHLQSFKPDIVCVGFNMIKQEFWIEDNKEFLISNGTKIAIGCGGTFEMVSGELKNAPIMIQKLGLQGLFRLIIEPKWFRVVRLFRSIKFLKYL